MKNGQNGSERRGDGTFLNRPGPGRPPKRVPIPKIKPPSPFLVTAAHAHLIALRQSIIDARIYDAGVLCCLEIVERALLAKLDPE